MGLLSGNSCNIVTLLPLGLECDSIDASTPESNNGLLTLYITGGTPPYNVNWSNGNHGTLLTNVKPGTYTATVVDYYGDFTATTTCEVGYESFYLEELESCKDPNNKVYYLANLTQPLSGGTVYGLTTQIGCWLSSGTTLFTGQTYIPSFPVISSGPYQNCFECLPPPIPTPTYPSTLCFTYSNGETFTNVQVSSGLTINGYPSWSASPSNEIIYYNTGTTRWEISGWTGPGVPIFQNPTALPVGGWVILGAYGKTLTIVEGPCVTPPLNIRISKTNPLCSTSNNGSISITPYGGTNPYYYSIDGINYQTSNIFLNLSPGTYTVYVKDFNLNVVSQTVTLTPQQNAQNYTVSLNVTQGNLINVGNSVTKTSNWTINVTPYPLPVGTTIDLQLVFNINTSAKTLNTPSVVYTNTITPNQTGSFTITSAGTSTPIGTSTPNSLCPTNTILTSAYTTTYNVQLVGSGTITGTLTQYINTPCVENERCNLFAKIKDTISIQNMTISPITCKTVNNSYPSQEVVLEKTGLVCPKVA